MRQSLMAKYCILALVFLCSVLFAKPLPSSSKIQGRLNIINGASAECVMHKFYTNSGWTQIEGEIGRNGIDGLYYKKKNGIIKEVLVAESKWNKSRLGLSGKGKTVKQMSKEWVMRTMNKLVKKIDTSTYRKLRALIDNNQYRARLFRLKPVGKDSIQITIYKIKNKGNKAFDEIRDTQLRPMKLNSRRNRFEEGMIKVYNQCRSHYLHKYLPFLSDEEVEILLRDNNLQKKDIYMLSH